MKRRTAADCRAVRARLSARHDGEPAAALPPAHLETCAECARFARGLDRLSEELGGLREAAPSAALAARLTASLHRPQGRGAPRATGRRLLLRTAAAALGFLIVRMAVLDRPAPTRASALDLFARAGHSVAAPPLRPWPPEPTRLRHVLSLDEDSR